jgi:hypothetical protein
MASYSFIHGIVDNLGEQVVQRAVIGSANIHTRAQPHGLKPFKNLNVFGGVTRLSCAAS